MTSGPGYEVCPQQSASQQSALGSIPVVKPTHSSASSQPIPLVSSRLLPVITKHSRRSNSYVPTTSTDTRFSSFSSVSDELQPRESEASVGGRTNIVISSNQAEFPLPQRRRPRKLEGSHTSEHTPVEPRNHASDRSIRPKSHATGLPPTKNIGAAGTRKYC